MGSDNDTGVLASSAAALIGVSAYLGWWYASRERRLLADDVSDDEAKDMATTNLAGSDGDWSETKQRTGVSTAATPIGVPGFAEE